MLELPMTLVESLRRTPKIAAAAVTSPFTGSAQVQDWMGEWLEYELTFAAHSRAEGRKVSAFFDMLRGPNRPFCFRDPSFAPLVPYTSGSPVVYGAGQTGEYLVTGGWTAGQQIAAGDYFNVWPVAGVFRLYRVVADAEANGSGRATLQLFPSLREAPQNGAALDFAAPGVLLRLTTPPPSQIGRAEIYRFTVTAAEHL